MSARATSFHHLLKAAILFGFAAYIAHLIKTDNILYYIAPRMVDYVKWTAVAFYAIGIHQLYAGVRALWGRTEPCDCDHDHTPSRSVMRNIGFYGLFIAPLLLGFALPDASLGSSLAAKKGMNLSSSSSVKNQAAIGGAGQEAAASAARKTESGSANISESELKKLFPSDKFTEHYAKYAMDLYKKDVIRVKEEMYMETLTSIDLYADAFVGKKVELTGFVYREEPMKDNQFVVGRFALQCCSADAAPYGLLAEFPQARNFQDDAWVTVTGTIRKTTFDGNEIMMLQLEKAERAEAPKTKYVYPNPDFGL